MLVVAGPATAENSRTRIDQWRWSGDLSLARTNACAALLPDGRILVAGGAAGGAPTASTELYDGSGAFTAAAWMAQPREDAACVSLRDGRVLVSGGRDAASLLRTTEIYDPATDSWSPGPPMASPRAGHAVTLTPWGAVLVSGGDSGGVVELIGPNGGTTVGTIPAAAGGAAVAALPNRKIVIAGGTTSEGVTDGIWLYDVDSDAIALAGRMLTPRRAFAAAALLDGTVIFTGGYGAAGSALATAEIFDPRTGTSTAAPDLSGPRAGHRAFTLPNNGQVLLVGGSDAQGTLQSTEKYVPWIGRFAPAAPLLVRQSAMAAALTRRGGLMVAGGRTDSGPLGSAELYSFATIETNKDDYQPGDTATFTGSGWRPGEQVFVQVTSLPPDQHHLEFTGTAIADGSGEIRLPGFRIDRSHLGVAFLVTAAGMESTAQSRFSDADNTTTTISLSPSSVQNFNQALTITGHVEDITSPATNPVNAGTVAVRLDAIIDLGTLALDGSGNFQIVVPASTIAPGVNHQIVASYSGGGREPWIASSSSPVSYSVYAPTTLSFINPISGATAAYGTGQTFTAQVLPGLGAPAVATGSVRFYNRLTNAPLSGDVAVDGTGTAQFTANTLPVGTNHLRADYTPTSTSGYQASSSYPNTDYTYVVTKATAQMNVTIQPVSPLVGDSVHFSAAIAQAGAAIPTGTVTFQDGLTAISGPIALVNGQVADFAYVFPNAAVHPITAVYSGDSTYSGGVSAILSVSVAKANTAAAVDSSVPASIAYSQSIQLQGHVSISPASFGSPTTIGGTAEFRDNGAPISGARDLGVGPGGAVQAAAGIPAVPFPPGDHQITLHYNGDANYSPSDSPLYLIHVNPAASTTTISSDVAAAPLGSAVTYKATVTVTPPSAYSGAPPGRVTIYDSSGPTPVAAACSGQALTAGAPGVSTFSCTVVYNGVFPLNGGAHNITATYTGDPSIGAGHPQIAGSASGAISVNIAKADASVGAPVADVNPSRFGQPVNLSVSVNPAAGGPEVNGTTTIDFFDNGALVNTSGPIAVSAHAASTPPLSNLAVGGHVITTVFHGSSNYNDRLSGNPSLTLNVQKGDVAIGAVTVAGQPTLGNALTLSTAVSAAPPAAGTPAGTVHFFDNSVEIGTSGQNPASIVTTGLAAGSHTITASYDGSPNFNSHDAAGTATVVVVAAATPSIVLSAGPLPATVANGYALTATVTGTGAFAPNGTVAFFANGNPVPNGACAGLAVSTPPGGHTGTAVCQPGINLAAGTYSITAHFRASAAAPASYTDADTAAAYSLTVNPIGIDFALSADHDPVTVGQPIVFTAVASGGSSSAPPSGTVSFFADGNPIVCVGANPAPIVLNAGIYSAVCGFPAGFGSFGVHNVSIVYNPPNGNSAVRTVQPNPLPVQVNQSTVDFSFTASANPSNFGQAITLTVTIAPHAGAGTPTGSVTFFDNGAALGSARPLNRGSASLTIGAGAGSDVASPLGVGSHAITAQYGGDGNFAYTDSAQTQAPSTKSVSLTVNPGVVNVGVVAPSSGSQVYSAPVVLTATVSPASSGAPTPAGNVQFWDGAVGAGSPIGNPAPLNGSGSAQISVSNLNVGSHLIYAQYLGSSSYGGGNSPSGANLVIGKGETTTILDEPPAAAAGAQITLTARVTLKSPATGSLSGTVNFYDYTLSTLIGSASINASGVATVAVNVTSPNLVAIVGGSAVGTHPLFAVYQGSGNYSGSQSDPQNFTVQKGSASVTLSSAPSASVWGQPVALTATVQAISPASGIPTGSVQFFRDGSALGSPVSLTTAGGLAKASLTVPNIADTTAAAFAVGDHAVSATYSGDPSFGGASSSAFPQSVGRANTVTSISSSGGSLAVGQNVTVTATVQAVSPGAGTPTGDVAFLSGSAASPLGSARLAPSAAGNSATASITLASLPQGNVPVTASYAGDANFIGSASTVLNQSVTKTSVTLSLSSSLNPSIAGQQVSYLLTVAPSSGGGALPTGAVQFFDGTTPIATIQLAGGQASFTCAPAVGTHLISASYGGDTTFQQGVTSSSITQTVNRVPAALSIVSSAATATASQMITLTAQIGPVPPAGVSPPSGSVTFSDGDAALGAASLVSGTASLKVNSLGAGVHQITAVYGGDGVWGGAQSAPLSQTITRGQTAVRITTSANPSVFGQPLTLTVTVAVNAPGTAPQLGRVQLWDNNSAIGDPVPAPNGKCSLSVPALTPGAHNIRAQFIGDADFESSQSAPLMQEVNKAPTNTAVAAMPSSSGSGDVLLTAVVSVPAPGSGLPSGSVQFTDGTTGKLLGNAPLRQLGGVFAAQLTTGGLTQAGAVRSIAAAYSGDANFSASQSAAGGVLFGSGLAAVNAAGYGSSTFAPDEIATLFGDHLAGAVLSAATVPLPDSLGNTTVKVTDSAGVERPAQLFFVSPGQVNFLIPSNTAPGLARIAVHSGDGEDLECVALIARTAPGIFSANATGKGVAAAYVVRGRSDGSQERQNVAQWDAATNQSIAAPIDLGDPAEPVFLELYGTGFRYSPGLSSVTVTLNGQVVPVTYAGASPAFAGLDQIDLQLPGGLKGAGVVTIVVTVDGQAANAVTIFLL